MSTLSELDCARSVRSASATVGPSAAIAGGRPEVGDDHGLLRSEGALAAQRSRRPDAERSADHEPDHEHRERAHRQAAADPGSAPGHVGTRLEREGGQGALGRHAAAGRVLRRGRKRPVRGALHEGGDPDDRQPREHHAERAGKHPVGETDDLGGRPGRRLPTAAVARAQRPSALPIGNRPPCRIAGTAAAFAAGDVTVSSTRTSSLRLLRARRPGPWPGTS